LAPYFESLETTMKDCKSRAQDARAKSSGSGFKRVAM
jgi:hypothetical protein